MIMHVVRKGEQQRRNKTGIKVNISDKEYVLFTLALLHSPIFEGGFLNVGTSVSHNQQGRGFYLNAFACVYIVLQKLPR